MPLGPWVERRVHVEIQQDLFDLRSRAQQLEEELRRLRHAQLRPDVALKSGVRGVVKIGRKVLGLGGRVQAILTRHPRDLVHRVLTDEEQQAQDRQSTDSDDGEIDDEFARRRTEIEAELQYVREQEQVLQRMEVGTAKPPPQK